MNNLKLPHKLLFFIVCGAICVTTALASPLTMYRITEFYTGPDIEHTTAFPLHEFADFMVLGKDAGWTNVRIKTRKWIIIPPGTEVEGWVMIR